MTTSYKFEDFELDTARFELRRKGRALKVERIPMELLILLIEKNGNVASRQEIIDRLWGKDVFVDTEHGINTAIRKVRQVLQDDPEQPRFVQTVTGKGYRFVGQVTADAGSGSVAIPVSSGAVPAAVDHVASSSWSPLSRILLPAILVACVMASLGFAYWRSVRPRVSPQHLMLVALPFENLSGDPGQEYFTDGLTEEMITQLGSLNPEHLGVISRTTSMVYKHTTKSAWDIGQELGVDYVLESSVRREGEQVRITVQLIRTSDQSHVWAHNYDRHIGGSIALQEEVARAIADQIAIKLGPEYDSRPARSAPDPAAYEAYLRGRFFYNQFTAEGYRRAITYFQQAIDRDPDFAEAYSGIADCYHFLIITDTIAPSEGTPRIIESAQRAVALGNSLAESHNSMGGALKQQYQWAAAEEEFRRAISLNRSYSEMHRMYAALLAAELRHKEAWEQINEAMRTDPLSLPNNAELVRTLYYARDYDGALAQAKKALQLDPGYYRTHFWMARVYAQKRMFKAAIDEDSFVLKATPDSNMALTEMAYSLGVGGRTAEARKILHALEQRAKTDFLPVYNLAIIHVALGENDVALHLLDQAYVERDWAMLVLACEPRLDPLRNSPRFHELLVKIGLPERARH